MSPPLGKGADFSFGGSESRVSLVLTVEMLTWHRSVCAGSDPEISPRASRLVKKVLPEALWHTFEVQCFVFGFVLFCF